MTETAPRHLLILGSTGSIGRQALEVAATLPQVMVVGLAAGSRVDLLLEQAAACGARAVCLRDAKAAAEADARAPGLTVLAGEAGLRELISRASERAAAAGAALTVLNGIVGAAGLRATMATLEAGATLALANKESMVAGGPFVLEAARRSGSLILPVDSEHSAIFQCLAAGGGEAGTTPGTTGGTTPGTTGGTTPGTSSGTTPGTTGGATTTPAAPAGRAAGPAIEEILLTGSGGPFRGYTVAELAGVTPEEALKHPTWSMGPKISIDSATLMNKGLEVIEAHYLFGVPYERITVVLNPQSVVHSMVRFADGAILAHLGVPDMRTPIGFALAYPERPPLPMVKRLDLFATDVSFHKPDTATFRCLALAQEAGRKAAIVACDAENAGCAPRTVAAPIVLNAANEIAVQAFLDRHVAFTAIAEIVEKCLTWLGDEPVESLEDVYACDEEARRFAREAAGRPA